MTRKTVLTAWRRRAIAPKDANGAFTASLPTSTPRPVPSCSRVAMRRARARIHLRECSPHGQVCEYAMWHTLSLHLVTPTSNSFPYKEHILTISFPYGTLLPHYVSSTHFHTFSSLLNKIQHVSDQ